MERYCGTEPENHTDPSTITTEIGHHAEFAVPPGIEIETNDRGHHLSPAIATFLAGPHDAVLEVPIGTEDQIEPETLAAVRAGDVGTPAAAGYAAQFGDLHLQLEGVPGGPHHAFPLPRDGMIGLTVHGRPAEILTTGTSGKL